MTHFVRPKVPIYDRGRNEDMLGDDGTGRRNGSPLRRSPYRQLGPSRFEQERLRTDVSKYERTAWGWCHNMYTYCLILRRTLRAVRPVQPASLRVCHWRADRRASFVEACYVLCATSLWALYTWADWSSHWCLNPNPIFTPRVVWYTRLPVLNIKYMLIDL